MIARALLLAVLMVAPSWASASPAEADDGAARALEFLAARWTSTYPLFPRFAVLETLPQIGVDPKTWPSPADPAWAHARPVSSTDYEAYKESMRVAYGVATAGYDPRDVHGVDYVQRVRDGFVAGQFGDVTYDNDDVWGVLALVAAGVGRDDPMVRQGVDNILAARSADGGWSHYVAAVSSDTDSTGMALVALAAAGHDLSRETRALAFLRSMELPDGAFQQRASVDGPNCQATVWGIHGYAVLGVDAARSVGYLRDLQARSGEVGNPWCTVEALPILGGARMPFPGYAEAALDAPTVAGAGETVRLRVGGPFTSARWNLGAADAQGVDVSVTFPVAGTYSYSVVAEGDGVRGRAHGVIEVGAGLPRLVLAQTSTDARRGEAFTLDARGSYDPDGRVVALEVEWGDGNRTDAATLVAQHAYETPGARDVRARVRDDAGAWSAPVTLRLVVENRAPVLSPLPPSVATDRVAPVPLSPVAADPEGDAVSLSWRSGRTEGAWPPDLRGWRAGEHVLVVRAEDVFGARDEVEVALDLVNLEPELREVAVPGEAALGRAFAFAASASDADGPAPRLLWTFGDERVEGASGTFTPATVGPLPFTLTVVDSDGATRVVTGRVEVREAAEPKNATSAGLTRVHDLRARFDGDALVVSFVREPADARAIVRWTSDAGDGEAAPGADGLVVPLPDATRAQVLVEVVSQDGAASARAEARRPAPSEPLAAPRLIAPAEGGAGEPVRFEAAPPSSADRWRFDFGDGNVTPWARTTRVLHVYDAPGVRTVVLEARTADGRASSARGEVVVRPAPGAGAAEPPQLVVVVPPPLPALEPVDLVTRSAEDPQATARSTPAPWGALLVASLAACALARRRR